MPKGKAPGRSLAKATRATVKAKGMKPGPAATAYTKEVMKSEDKAKARGRAGSAARKIAAKKGTTPKAEYKTRGK